MGLSHSPKIVTDGLVLCLDAANRKSYPGSGNTWLDLSGRGANFTWNTSPTLSSSGSNLHFETNGKFATGPASNSFGITSNGGYTIFMLCQQITLTLNFAFCFSKTGTQPANRGIISHIVDPNGNVYLDQGGCCGSDTRTNVAASASSWNLWGFRRITGTSTRQIIQNNKVIVTNSNAAADIALNSDSAYVNKYVNSTEFDGTWNARLSMFFVYNRSLSDNEVQQNFNSLRGRYGL